ncbi:MAG: hypothetical protein IJ254_05545 [Succinivibrio sp.]|nr:hypothetical protein [Succinivibrio sp.]
MAAYSGVFKKSIEVTVSAKKQDSDAQNALVFFNPAREVPDVAYGVDLTEGVSVPFELKLTILTTYQPSRSDLKDHLLKSNYTVTLRQGNSYDATVSQLEKVQRERVFKGIVTSYQYKGKSPSLPNTDKSCYIYELTIAPEMIELGLHKRTAHYSGKKVTEIIKDLFKAHDLEANCQIDASLLGKDTLDDTGYVFEQNNETDLDFLQRLCYLFSLNYTFAYEDGRCNVVFSRVSALCSSFPVKVLPEIVSKEGEHSAASAAVMVQAFLNSNIELEASERNYVQDIAYKGGITEGSIFSEDSIVDNLQYNLQSNINTDIAGNAKQLAYIKESIAKTKEKVDEYLVAKSSDLIFASGVHFKVNDANSIYNDSQCLVVRSYLKFNVKYPVSMPKVDAVSPSESPLYLRFAAIPAANSTNDVLGSLNIFAKLNNTMSVDDCLSIDSNNQITASTIQNTCSSVKTVIGVVCDIEGKINSSNTETTTETTTEKNNRKAKESNFSSFDKFYVRLDLQSKTPTVVVCDYVSAYGSLGNLPKLGSRVVMLYTGNKYYYLGQIATNEVLGLNNEKLLKQRSDSLILQNDTQTSVIDIKAASDNEIELMKLMLSGEMPLFIDKLNFQNNSLRPKEIFEKNIVRLGYSLAKEATSSDAKAHEIKLTKVNKKKTFAQWTEKLPQDINSVKELMNSISMNLSNSLIEGQTDKEEKLRDSYEKCIQSLNSLNQAMKTLSTSLAKSLESYLSFKGKDNISIKTPGEVVLSSVEQDEEGSFISVSSDSGVTINAPVVNEESDSSGQLTLNAGKNLNISAEQSITLNVGNSTITIDAGGINLTAKKFKENTTLWDSSITIDGMTGIQMEAFDTNIDSFSSTTISDGFGAEISTLAGKVTVNGTNVDIENTRRDDLIYCLTNLSKNVATWITSAVEAGQNYSDEERRDAERGVMLFSNIVDTYQGITKIIRDVASATNASSRGEKLTAACSAIAGILKIVDLIEDIVATSIDIDQRKDENQTWEARNEENNYLSKRDVFRMTTSTIAKTALLIGSMPSFFFALKSPNVSSMSVSPDEISVSSQSNKSFYVDLKASSTVAAGKNII